MFSEILYTLSIFSVPWRTVISDVNEVSPDLDLPAFEDPQEIRIEEENILKQYSSKCTGIVYFLHPSGVNATWMRKYLQSHQADLNFKHLKLIFPDAPLIRYTPLDAIECRAWIDRQDRTNLGTEDEETVENSCRRFRRIIEQEVQSGIPLNRIIIGGLQTGGEMALHMAYRCFPDIAGVFALSTFLRQKSKVYRHLLRNKTSGRPPLLQAIWVKDRVIPPQFSQDTFDELRKFGVKGELLTMRHLEYIMSAEELTHVWRWICKILPNKDKKEGFDLDYYFNFNDSSDSDELTVESDELIESIGREKL